MRRCMSRSERLTRSQTVNVFPITLGNTLFFLFFIKNGQLDRIVLIPLLLDVLLCLLPSHWKCGRLLFWSPCIYLFICMRVIRITKKVLNRKFGGMVGYYPGTIWFDFGIDWVKGQSQGQHILESHEIWWDVWFLSGDHLIRFWDRSGQRSRSWKGQTLLFTKARSISIQSACN